MGRQERREKRLEKKRAKLTRKLAELPPASQPDTSGAVAASSAPADKSLTPRKMCGELQKALRRPVVRLPDTFLGRTKRGAIKNRRALLGLGAVGLGIASVATGGLLAAALGVGAASFPIADFSASFDAEIYDSNPIELDKGAVKRLLDIPDPTRRLITFQAAVKRKSVADPNGTVRLVAEDIIDEPTQAPLDSLRARIGALQVGVRAGLAVFGAGVLLLALTLIPEDIHTTMTRVASAILVIGTLIVGATFANSSWRSEH